MSLHTDLWVTTATAASAILVATAVALTQSMDTMVERVRQQHDRNTPGSRPWIRDRRASLARSYLAALASIVLTTEALFVSILSLLFSRDVAPPWTGAVPILAGTVLIFLQVILSANAKLGEVRAISVDTSER